MTNSNEPLYGYASISDVSIRFNVPESRVLSIVNRQDLAVIKLGDRLFVKEDSIKGLLEKEMFDQVFSSKSRKEKDKERRLREKQEREIAKLLATNYPGIYDELYALWSVGYNPSDEGGTDD